MRPSRSLRAALTIPALRNGLAKSRVKLQVRHLYFAVGTLFLAAQHRPSMQDAASKLLYALFSECFPAGDRRSSRVSGVSRPLLRLDASEAICEYREMGGRGLLTSRTKYVASHDSDHGVWSPELRRRCSRVYSDALAAPSVLTRQRAHPAVFAAA